MGLAGVLFFYFPLSVLGFMAWGLRENLLYAGPEFSRGEHFSAKS